MSGVYIFCRTWKGFKPEFPWYEELNSLPDEEVIPALEQRCIDWRRRNREEFGKLMRKKLANLRNDWNADESQATTPPNGHRGSLKDSYLEDRVKGFSWNTLRKEARRLGVKIKGKKKPQLIRDVVAALNWRAYKEQKMTQIRGPRRSSRAYKTARLCGWAGLTEPGFGGLSPSPKLFLGRVEDDETARQILDVLRDPFGGFPPVFSTEARRTEHGEGCEKTDNRCWWRAGDAQGMWYVFNPRFGHVAADNIGTRRASRIDFFLQHLKAEKPRDPQSAAHRFFVLEFERVAETGAMALSKPSGRPDQPQVQAQARVKTTVQPVKRQRQRSTKKAGDKDFKRARNDTIAEAIRTVARNGEDVTSELVSRRCTGSDGKQIPEGTIRSSEAWKDRERIMREAGGSQDPYECADYFSPTDGDVVDGSSKSPVDELIRHEDASEV